MKKLEVFLPQEMNFIKCAIITESFTIIQLIQVSGLFCRLIGFAANDPRDCVPFHNFEKIAGVGFSFFKFKILEKNIQQPMAQTWCYLFGWRAGRGVAT